MIASSYPFLSVIWTLLVIFAWVIWFWLLITVFADLFRRHDISGWVKALWIIFVIVLPFLGVLVYLIAESHGHRGEEPEAGAGAAVAVRRLREDRRRASDPTEQIAKAKGLLDSGAITQAEFDSIKAKALAA